jgi:replicative DNA helicase
MNYIKKMVKQKLKKQNVIKYATWNVREITHKEEELDSVLKQKQTEIAAIKKKVTLETLNYTIIYNV